jgi:hypothetical protein
MKRTNVNYLGCHCTNPLSSTSFLLQYSTRVPFNTLEMIRSIGLRSRGSSISH